MKENVDTIVISDIHLGSPLSRTQALVEALRGYRFKRLVLNGDIFNDLDLSRLNRHHWNFLSYIRKQSRQAEVIWIAGNHDGAALKLSHLIGVQVYTKYVWKSEDRRFMAIHGHQFDRFLYKNLAISKVAVFAYYTAQRVVGNNLILENWLKKKSSQWLRLSAEVCRSAIYYASLNHADVIFCGHTHIMQKKSVGRIAYYNTGSWVDKLSGMAVIKDGVVSLREIN